MLVSCDCHSRLPLSGLKLTLMVKITGIYSLTVLKERSPKSRSGQYCSLQRFWRRIHPLPLAACGGCRYSLPCGGITPIAAALVTLLLLLLS